MKKALGLKNTIIGFIISIGLLVSYNTHAIHCQLTLERLEFSCKENDWNPRGYFVKIINSEGKFQEEKIGPITLHGAPIPKSYSIEFPGAEPFPPLNMSETAEGKKSRSTFKSRLENWLTTIKVILHTFSFSGSFLHDGVSFAFEIDHPHPGYTSPTNDGDFSWILKAKKDGTWTDLSASQKALSIGHDWALASYGVIEDGWNNSFGILSGRDKSDPLSFLEDVVDFSAIKGAAPLFKKTLSNLTRKVSRAQGSLRKVDLTREGPHFGMTQEQINSFAGQHAWEIQLRNDAHLKRIYGHKSKPRGGYLGTFQPKNPQEGIQLYALGDYNSLSRIRPVTIEGGSTILVGRVADQNSIRTIQFQGKDYHIPTSGGARQIFILGGVQTKVTWGKSKPLFNVSSKDTKK